MSDYWKKVLEEYEQNNKKATTTKPTTTKSSSSYWQNVVDEYKANNQKKTTTTTKKKKDEDDVAPVRTFTNTRSESKLGEENEDLKRTWFQKGAFEDGWQFGDVAKTILGTFGDVKEKAGASVLGMGETILDSTAMMAPVAKLATKWTTSPTPTFLKMLQLPQDIERLKEESATASEFVKKDLYDEDEIAKKLLTGYYDDIGLSTDDSVLGEKSDNLVKSGSQVAAIAAASSFNAPGALLMALTSFGGEAENALNQDATYGEAMTSAAITAGAEILTEKISGGINLVGGKTLDDALTKRIARNVSNKVGRTVAKLFSDVTGEGLEEIFSGVISAVGQKLTYADEKELTELFTKEDAWESFVGGAVIGGLASGANTVKSNLQGVDSVSGFTKNEQAVVDKEYQDRIAEEEAEKKRKLTQKEKSKIYDRVVEEMDKGYISTDTIEEVLGGETYKAYKDTVDSEDALFAKIDEVSKEFTELNQMKNGEMTGEQTDRRAELKQQMEELRQQVLGLKDTSQRFTLKNKLSEEVSALVQGDRLVESYNERGRRSVAFEADLSQIESKHHDTYKKAVESGVLNNTHRSHELVELIAKISTDKGLAFDFTNNQKLRESGFAVDNADINGFVTKDGVTLNVNSQKALNSVVGHEITHVLEGTEVYDVLQQTIVEYAKSKGEYQSRYDAIAKLYEGIEGANVDAELTADLVGDYLFTDPDFIHKLSTENRNVFQKIWDEVKYLCKVATAGSKEARELAKLEKAFADAYREGGKGVDGTKYSMSDNTGKELTKEQNEYFKDSKMRDDNGNLMVMYHGSQDAGFHVFDPKMSDDHTSFFFVDRNDVAASYSGTYETYEAKSFRTVDDANNFFKEIGKPYYEVVEQDGKFVLLENGDFVAESDTTQGIYEEYCDWDGVGYGDANYKVYLNLTNPLVVDAEGRNWDNVSREFSQEVYDKYQTLTAEEKEVLMQLATWDDFSVFRSEIKSAAFAYAEAKANGREAQNNDALIASAYQKLGGKDTNFYDLYSITSDGFTETALREFAVKQMNTRDYAARAKEQGYDGVIFKNIHDNGGYSNGSEGASTVAIAFNSNQIKSVANEKPTSDKDIRYSLSNPETDKDYLDAVKRGDTELAQKMVDDVAKESGYTVRAYHGTNAEFFTFDKGRVGKGTDQYGAGFYFASDKEAAGHYGNRVIDSALKLENPYTISAVNLLDAEITLTDEQAYEVLKRHPMMYDPEESPLGDYYDSYWESGVEEWMVEDLAMQYTDLGLLDSDLFRDYPNELHEAVRDVTGHDGVVVNLSNGEKFYIAWFDNQMKSTDPVTYDDAGNAIPLSERFNTENNDIRYSLSKKYTTPKSYGKNNIYGKDVALEEAPVAPVEDAATVVENATVEEVAPVEEKTAADLADIAKQARRENMRGAYTHNGKQYLSDGSFVAEFNTVDESLEQSQDFPIKRAVKELDEAFARKVEGNYDLHISDTKGFIKVSNSLFGTKRVNALIRALENPVFSIANVRGGHEALVVTADNGRAVLMPVSASGNAYQVYEAQPIDIAPLPDNLAPISEEDAARMASESLDSLTDADMPPEVDAPYYGKMKDNRPNDPFAERDIGEVGNRKVKAYMYENPEVKPFFQQEARGLLQDLQNTVKGERWYNSGNFGEYGVESYYKFGGTKRHTSDDIAYLLDNLHYSYAEIEKGINAIIEDNGAENNACSKRIEFILHDRLMNGYTDFFYGYEVQPNQEYIHLIEGKQITEYSKDAFDALVASGDLYAPPVEEDIAPVAMANSNPTVTEKYEAIKPKVEKQPRMARATPEEQARNEAQVLADEPKVEKKKSRLWEMAKRNLIDRGTVFETMSLKQKNPELQAKYKAIGRAEGSAQWLMENGTDGVKSLDAIRKQVGEKSQLFSTYLYHKLNVDRMTLAERYENTPNKPVFGDSMTAAKSQEYIDFYEYENPEFKQWADDVYDYMTYLRGQMVDSGIISEETAELWSEMYPHYVPIRRVGDEGLNINVPLDTNKTGVNAPIKRATGGSRDILPLFDTMAMRTEQTYKAVAKNSFGVELKNMLGSTLESADTTLDEVLDSVDANEELLQEGKNGSYPTFTVFEDGKRVKFEITEEMYNELKPKSDEMAYTNKVLNKANDIRRGLLTEYNPAFMLTNPIKDTQDVLMNSKHPARTYANYPKAIAQLASKGKWYQEYMEHGGSQNTYFDGETNTFVKEKSGLSKVIGFPLEKISEANNFIERIPRMAEYIASREMGKSVDVSMLDAARVTTDFSAGGDLVKLANRNGFTFLNASVQGAVQQVRNIREAKHEGLKGWAKLAAKVTVAGMSAIVLNHLLWDDDEDYAELSDYVKQNYWIVGKYGDGKFVRIPKGRTLAVIQNTFEQMENLITGNDEVDFDAWAELLISNLAPNNPLENNIIAPITQALNNKAWYGGDLVPTRLQDLPVADQYDETTDSISKWLGEKLNISPYKINYVLDQYSGGVGDMLLPMLTPEAERGNESVWGDLLAPISDKFTTDSVLKNQNVSDFYDKKDELAMNTKIEGATEEDVLMSKYMNSINSELSELYATKREIQNSDLTDAEKYEQVREIQSQIVDLTRESLNTYDDIQYHSERDGEYSQIGDRYFKKDDEGEWQKLSDEQVTKFKATSAAGNAPYATDGTNHYRWYEPDGDSTAEAGWRKITDTQLEKQREVTKGLGITAKEYWGNKEEYDYAYEYPDNYAVAKAVGGYDAYKGYSSELYDIKADKDANGKSISGSRKEKVLDYINNLDADYYTRIILWKKEYNSDDTYNREIIEYLNGREDISREEEILILRELGFEVDSEGNIYW